MSKGTHPVQTLIEALNLLGDVTVIETHPEQGNPT